MYYDSDDSTISEGVMSGAEVDESMLPNQDPNNDIPEEQSNQAPIIDNREEPREDPHVDPEIIFDDLDMDEENSEDEASNGMIKEYLEQVRSKIKDQVKVYEAPKCYLSDTQSFWYRPKSPIFNQKKFDPGEYCQPDVFIWLPRLIDKNLKLHCPHCADNQTIVKDWPMPRRVISLTNVYYILCRRYECKKCKSKKRSCIDTIETFNSTHPKVISKMPSHFQLEFPALLTHRSGLDLTLINLMRTCFVNGFGPDLFKKLIRENHVRSYHEKMLKYLSKFQAYMNDPSKKSIIDKYRKPDAEKVLSSFPSFKASGGAKPSTSYFTSVYCQHIESLRGYMDGEIMKLSGEALKADHSFKVPKHMSKINGQPIFEALYTVTNEYGEIRSQILTFDKGQDQIKNALINLRRGLETTGFEPPKVFFVDDSVQSKSFLEGIFPSLKQNVTPVLESKYRPLELPDGVDVALIQRSHIAEDAINELIQDAENSQIAVGFDCEWNWDAQLHIAGKVALIQIAYKDKITLIQVSVYSLNPLINR